MPENHEDPRKEVKRINDRLETISNAIFRLTSEAETLNQRRSEIIEKYREMLQ
jgi:signal transduction protein with GAF and PtsI domain